MQKQINPNNEFGPDADKPIHAGNKAAADMAAKTHAALTEAESDALLLAQRNAVLDAAIERLGDGRWVTGDLVSRNVWTKFQQENPGDSVDWHHDEISELFWKLAREEGESFCLIGALGASVGTHSWDAVNQAVMATAASIPDSDYTCAESHNYGFTNDGIYRWNDAQDSAAPVLAALKAAKSQPLRK